MSSTDDDRDQTLARRLEEIGLLAGRVAHDLSNLLTPLVAYPELIRKDLAPDSRGYELLGIMEETIHDISRINQQMLMVSTRTSTEGRPFSVNDTILRVIALMEEAPMPPSVSTSTRLADDLDDLFGNQEQILRVVQNLCQNAMDAMQDGGELMVTTSMVRDASQVDDLIEGRYVHIAVADTGIGIPNDIIDRVCEPFFTTKGDCERRGSGLGLSIVSDIVKDYEGRMSIKSKQHEGTTFNLYLPAQIQAPDRGPAKASVQPEAAEAPEASKPFIPETRQIGHNGSPSLIIVDDEEHIRRIFALVLASAFPDLQIDLASNGREAVDACRANDYSVIVMDLRMPVMDGREAFGAIQHLHRESNREMPAVVFCTGFAPPDVVQEIVGSGRRHCLLSKPVRSELLISKIKARLVV